MSLINSIPIIKKESWESAVEFSKKTRQALQQLAHLRLGVDSSPTFVSPTFTGLTASRLVQTNASKKLTSVSDLTQWVAGVPNEIDIASDGDGTITIGIVNPLIVAKGGTGTATLTDHSILVGSGTDPITALTAATNGQLPIGSTGADPVIAALTGTTDRLTVTNGAGSITLDLGAHTQTLLDSFNGTFLETIDFTISEADGTVTGSLEQDSGGDLTQRFSDGYSTLDCTPAKTINLTSYVGSNAVPKEVFVYILQSNKTTIAASNSDWPATEHIKIANLVLKSAATTGTDGGALGNRNWNDHAQDASSQGHVTDIEKRVRQEPTQHDSGVALTLKNSGGTELTTTNSSTAVEIVTSEGTAYQLHKHTFPAFDMYLTATDDAHIVNQPTDRGGAYETTVALVSDITHYVDGTAAGVAIGNNKYFNLVIWGIQNRSGEVSHVMINLPTGQYTNSADAVSDIDGTSVYDIPSVLKGLGFLIARLTFRLVGAEWTYIAQEDLRGQFPNVSAGVGIKTTDHALLANLTFASAGHTGFQAQGDVLDDLNTLGTVVSDGQFIVGTGGGAFAYETPAQALATLSGEAAAAFAWNSQNLTGIGTIGSGAITSSGASTFNSGSVDADFTVNWNTGIGLFVQGSDGRVGIGTGSPNAPLEVKGPKPAGNVGGFQSGMFHVTGSGTAQFSNSVITGHSAYDTNTQLWYLGSTTDTNNDIAFINRQNAPMHFYTNNANRMTIDASGNVGINVTDPDAKLEVVGTLHISDAATFDSTITASNYTAANLLTACATSAGGLDFSSDVTLTVAETETTTNYHTDARAATWLAANHETTYTHTDISLNTSHRTSDGSDHTHIDQAVTIAASPTFAGLTISGTAAVEGASVTIGKASTTTGTLVLHDSGSANTITLTVPNALAASLSFTLPPTDGADTNVLQTDGNGVLTWVAAGGGAGNHAMLDGTVHTDSLADDVSQGSIIYGNATPKWDELVLGGADTFLGSDGTDLSYRTAAQVMASLSAEAGAAFDLNGQDLTNGGVLFLTEQAAAEADVAGKGQFWVKDDVPNTPQFTDDTGDDHKLRTTAKTQTVNLLQSDNTAAKQAKIDAVPKFIPHGNTVTFQFETGSTHTETATLNFLGFYGGGDIAVHGNTGEANATVLHLTQDTFLDFTTNPCKGLYFYGCYVFITIRNLKIQIQDVASSICIQAYICNNSVFVYNSYLLGSGVTTGTYGFYATACAIAYCDQTYFEDVYYGIRSRMGTLLSYTNADNPAGTMPKYGLYAEGAGVIGKIGEQPDGSIADERIANGGVIR